MSSNSRQISPEEALEQLAGAFVSFQESKPLVPQLLPATLPEMVVEPPLPEPESMYRALVEQIPAVVFIAYLDRGTSEAYVSPQIESALGFSQEEWLDDPIRWYQTIHPADKARWSIEAAEMLGTGKPLKSAYRVITREGRILWFRCEAKIVRHQDGRPWFILGIGFEITDLKRTEEALQQRTAALRDLSANLLQLQDKERRRIARELHDGVGQYLVALKMNFDLLASGPAEDSKNLWAESERLLEQCLSETRSLAYLLHPPMLEDAGLISTINWYIEGFRERSGLDVNLSVSPDLPRLDSNTELAIYRVLQESLTNVIRHSGSKAVNIHLASRNGQISLEVRDHGRGVPQDVLKKFKETGGRVGVGLAGMRERIGDIGGHFDITSDSKGTSVRLELPMRVRDADIDRNSDVNINR